MGSVQVIQPNPAYRLNVIGVPGEGKSEYRSRFLSPVRRVTLANPMGDFHIGEVMTTDEYRRRMESFRRGVLRITVVPSTWEPEAMCEEFDALCAYVEEVGAQHFAIEEISLYRGESGARVPGNLNRICVRGRHRAVSMSVYGQRFHQFPLIVRGTATEVIAFRQADPDDVRDYNKRIAPDVPPVPLNQLAPFHFLSWTPTEGVALHAPLDLEASTLDSPILARGTRVYNVSDALEEGARNPGQ